VGDPVIIPRGVPKPSRRILLSKAVYFDSGNFVIGVHNYTFNTTTAAPGNVDVPCIEGGDTDYWINYSGPARGSQRLSYLRYIRLVPSNAQPEIMDGFTGGFNRSFTDYDDVVTELNLSCQDDPLNGEVGLNDVVGTMKFVADQVSFSYNDRFNKFVFTGLDDAESDESDERSGIGIRS